MKEMRDPSTSPTSKSQLRSARDDKATNGFFPNLFSLVIFLVIMVGLFFTLTTMYPRFVVERFLTQKGAELTALQSPSDALAPFVRGVLSGLESAAKTALPEQKPLNLASIHGFGSGIQSAILTSKNWFDLDRQLFKSKGLSEGMLTAYFISKSVTERSTLSYQVKLIGKIQQSLSVDLRELMERSSGNRNAVLTNYLQGQKDLASEARIEMANMERVVNESQSIVDLETAAAATVGDTISSGVTNQDAQGVIDQNLDQYLSSRKRADEARVRANTTGQFLNQLRQLSDQLNRVIQAVEANFDALASGIKVSPQQGVNLPIFKE